MKTKTISVFDKYLYFLVLITMTIVFLPHNAFGQIARSHTITVSINKVTVVSVTPLGPFILDIPNGPTAVVTVGVNQMTVTDQSTTLSWGTNAPLTKISIRAILPSPQKFSLQALALGPPAGSTASNVTISATDQNFITNIGPSSGSTSVQYTGIALASDGIGSEDYPITFTITAP